MYYSLLVLQSNDFNLSHYMYVNDLPGKILVREIENL